MGPAVSVILPTYNEAESLPVLVPRIMEVLGSAQIPAEILVVDDDSPDGTAAVAERLGQNYPVRVIRRTQERGLATAVLLGFAQAQAPICVVMDADGSHPVGVLPSMVRMIESDRAEIVVGSRNIAGGGSRNWPLFSQLKSKAAASLTFGLTSMTDPTTGLMALRKSLLTGLQLDPVGWKIVLEIVVKAAPARVAEVPILFEDRELGQSKQSLHIFLQYTQHLLKLYGHRYRTLAELAKFCLIGVLGLLVDLGALVAIKELTHLDTRLCLVLSFAVAVTSNFFLNRRFTFAHGRDLPLLFSYLTYAASNLLGLSVRVGVVHALMVGADLDRGHGYVLSNTIGIVLATIFNFVGAKYFAFDPERLARVAALHETVTPARKMPRSRLVVAALLLGACVSYTSLASTVWRGLTTDDEGVNTTMARNIRADSERLLHPSVYPGGRADWVAEDLPALGNTPFYPGLVALAGTKWDLPGMGIVPWLSLWVTIVFSALLFWQQSPRSGLYTALLLASSPAFLAQALTLEFEPTLTAWCAAGLYFVVRGTRLRRLRSCFAGGVLLGLGFLTKLWLITPYVLGACGFGLVQTTLARERDDHPLHLRRSVTAIAAGFLLSASAHLLLVALLSPHDLRHWIESVYLGIFSGQGVTGGKLSGASDASAHSVWYYPAVLYQQHFHLLPLIAFGLPALLRRAHVHAISALAIAFGTWLGVVVLSVPEVKEPLYVLAVAPPWYALAGVSLAELESDSPMHQPANRATVQAVLWIMALAVIAAFAWWFAAPGTLSLRAVGLHAAGMLACSALGIAWMTRRSVVLPLLCACSIALGAFIVDSAHDRRADSYRALSSTLRPLLADAAPAYPSFVAPHSSLLMGYLGRAGIDWPARKPGDVLSDASLHAFLVGPQEQRRTDLEQVLIGLQNSCVELPLPAAARDYRLFELPHAVR